MELVFRRGARSGQSPSSGRTSHDLVELGQERALRGRDRSPRPGPKADSRPRATSCAAPKAAAISAGVSPSETTSSGVLGGHASREEGRAGAPCRCGARSRQTDVKHRGCRAARENAGDGDGACPARRMPGRRVRTSETTSSRASWTHQSIMLRRTQQLDALAPQTRTLGDPRRRASARCAGCPW